MLLLGDFVNNQQSTWTERTVDWMPNHLAANHPADGHMPIALFLMKASHSMFEYVKLILISHQFDHFN